MFRHGEPSRSPGATDAYRGPVSTASHALPVTVIIARQPVAGRETALVEWAHGITAAASAFPGHLGAQIYEPSAGREELIIVFSFESADQLREWESSAVRAEWVAKGDALSVGGQRTPVASGFESLFAPSAQAKTPPPRWKTATIIAIALYPMSLLINWLLIPALAGVPLVLRVLITTLIIVPWMAWLGVPYLSRWLHGWLNPPRG